MRLLISTFVCYLVFATMSFAQTGKGSLMIGGRASVQRLHESVADPGTYNQVSGSFSIAPTVGYFIVDNFLVGLQPSFSHTWAITGDKYTTTAAAIGPLVRYYFPIGKFAIFPELAINLGNSKFTGATYNQNTGTIVPQTVTRKITNYRAGAGVAWFVSPHIGIEGIIAYDRSRYEKWAEGNQSNFRINFGIQFYLPKKNKDE